MAWLAGWLAGWPGKWKKEVGTRKSFASVSTAAFIRTTYVLVLACVRACMLGTLMARTS